MNHLGFGTKCLQFARGAIVKARPGDDHEIALGECGDVVRGGDAGEDLVALGGAQALLRDLLVEALGDLCDRPLGTLGRAGPQNDVPPGPRRHLDEPCSHDPRSEDPHRVDALSHARTVVTHG